MKIRWIFWAVAGLGAVVAGALLVPESPYYYVHLMEAQPHYNGQPIRFWVKALDSDDPETRYEAIKALGAIGDDARVAVPRLATIMLEDDDRIARNHAAFSLSKMNPASEAALEPLTKALTDKELTIRMNAAIALFRLKKKAQSAASELVKCIEDESNKNNLEAFPLTIQEQMILALGAVTAGTNEAVDVLIERLKTTDVDSTRRAVVRALGHVGPPAKAAIPLLEPMVPNAPQDFRPDIEETIERINGAPKE